jgi:hypothetical protein
MHINLAERAIEFEDRYGTVGRLCFSSETVLYKGQPLLLVPRQPADPNTEAHRAVPQRQAPRRLSRRLSQNPSPPSSRSEL